LVKIFVWIMATLTTSHQIVQKTKHWPTSSRWTSNTTKWADRTLKHAFPSKKKIAFTFLQRTKFCEGKCWSFKIVKRTKFCEGKCWIFKNVKRTKFCEGKCWIFKNVKRTKFCKGKCWIFKNITFVKMKNLNLINYWTDM
jgi:hypothetical protein